MSSEPKPHLTPEEYLAFERTSEVRHEYLDGEILAMSGASRNHVRIAGNTFASLHFQLRDRPCEAYAIDLRVSTDIQRQYFYPDIVVACGDQRFHEEDTLLNPTVIVEVLSPSTADLDRGVKFWRYRQAPSLQEYVLIAQDAVSVEVFRRLPDGTWNLADSSKLTDVVALDSIGCALALSDVYARTPLAAGG